MRGKTLISIGTVLLSLDLLDRLYSLSAASRVGDTLGLFFSALVLGLGIWQSYRERKKRSTERDGRR